jgi:hypothetical protein
MLVPNTKVLGLGLRRWREFHQWTVKDVVQHSANASKRPFTGNMFWKWQKGTLTPSYARLVEDIFPALGIDSLQKMLVFFASFCQKDPGLDSITIIKKAEHSVDNSLGIPILFADERRVKPHLVRIDRLELKSKDETSAVTAHPGFNYLLVIKGKIMCSFWENKANAKAKPLSPDRKVTLNEGDAIAFQTMLPHMIQSVGSTATVANARPPWGHAIAVT